ncbi:MAG: hypothetical protein ACI857_003125 [Arenicella sp.]|jgi:hypothetical protein
MKCLVFILIALPTLSYSQSLTITAYDSIYIKVSNQISKEMVANENEIENEVLVNRKLTAKEEKKFKKIVDKKKSLTNNRSNLSHYNVEFNWYLHGKVNYQIMISTITGKTTFMDQANFYSMGLTSSGTKRIKKLLIYMGLADVLHSNDFFPEN